MLILHYILILFAYCEHTSWPSFAKNTFWVTICTLRNNTTSSYPLCDDFNTCKIITGMNVMGYSDVYKDPFIRHFTVSYFPINTILEIFCTFKLIDHVNLSIRVKEGLRKGNQICLNFNKNMDNVNSTWLTLEFEVFLLRHFLRIDPFRQNNKCFSEFIHLACINLMNVREFYCVLWLLSCIIW